jgi:hypothetical protein
MQATYYSTVQYGKVQYSTTQYIRSTMSSAQRQDDQLHDAENQHSSAAHIQLQEDIGINLYCYSSSI